MSKAKLNALLEEYAGNQRQLDAESGKLLKAIQPHADVYNAAVEPIQTRFKNRTAQAAARQKDLLKEIQAAMEKAGLERHEAAAAIAELSQAKERDIDPAAFLNWAGKKNRDGAMTCLKVQVTKADEVFGKEVLAGITTEKDKGKPKLAITVKE